MSSHDDSTATRRAFQQKLDQVTRQIAQSKIMRSRSVRSASRTALRNDYRTGRVQKPSSRTASPQHRAQQRLADSASQRSASPAASRWLYDDAALNQALCGPVQASAYRRPNSWHVSSPRAERFPTWQAPWLGWQASTLPPTSDWSGSTTRSSSITHNDFYANAFDHSSLTQSYNSGFVDWSSYNLPDAVWNCSRTQPITGTAFALQHDPSADLHGLDAASADVNLLGDCIKESSFLDRGGFSGFGELPLDCEGIEFEEVVEETANSFPADETKPDLIGVGLYDDRPARPGLHANWTLAQPDHRQFGKGLKLEEVFEPPDTSADTADSDPDGDDFEDDESSPAKSPQLAFDDHALQHHQRQIATLQDYPVGIVDYGFPPLPEAEYQQWMWPSNQTKPLVPEHLEFQYPMQYDYSAHQF